METASSVTSGQIASLNNVRSVDFVSVYANNAAFMLSFFDFSMTLGEVVSVEDGVGTVEQKVRVVMSLAHAKLFATLLVSQIQQYEQRFGVIALPPLENLQPEIQQILPDISGETPKEG